MCIVKTIRSEWLSDHLERFLAKGELHAIRGFHHVQSLISLLSTFSEVSRENIMIGGGRIMMVINVCKFSLKSCCTRELKGIEFASEELIVLMNDFNLIIDSVLEVIEALVQSIN